VLDPVEAAAVAAAFGVADEQVRRDHLLSHLLAVVFFGGTALAEWNLLLLDRLAGTRPRRRAPRPGHVIAHLSLGRPAPWSPGLPQCRTLRD
jgi:hypothetical protein